MEVLKLQYGGRPPYLKNVRNAITRLPMDQFRRSLGGRIQLSPRHVRHDALAMVTAVA